MGGEVAAIGQLTSALENNEASRVTSNLVYYSEIYIYIYIYYRNIYVYVYVCGCWWAWEAVS